MDAADAQRGEGASHSTEDEVYDETGRPVAAKPEDEPRREVVWTYQIRRRHREVHEEIHKNGLTRMRASEVQGHAASPGGMVGEIKEIHTAIHCERRAHGPAARAGAQRRLRRAYIELGTSCAILAERADRPPDLPRGEKGGKPGEGVYRPANFSVE